MGRSRMQPSHCNGYARARPCGQDGPLQRGARGPGRTRSWPQDGHARRCATMRNACIAPRVTTWRGASAGYRYRQDRAVPRLAPDLGCRRDSWCVPVDIAAARERYRLCRKRLPLGFPARLGFRFGPSADVARGVRRLGMVWLRNAPRKASQFSHRIALYLIAGPLVAGSTVMPLRCNSELPGFGPLLPMQRPFPKKRARKPSSKGGPWCSRAARSSRRARGTESGRQVVAVGRECGSVRSS
jgi:hypothetical protein